MPFLKGDKVRVINEKSAFFGWEGTVDLVYKGGRRVYFPADNATVPFANSELGEVDNLYFKLSYNDPIDSPKGEISFEWVKAEDVEVGDRMIFGEGSGLAQRGEEVIRVNIPGKPFRGESRVDIWTWDGSKEQERNYSPTFGVRVVKREDYFKLSYTDSKS